MCRSRIAIPISQTDIYAHYGRQGNICTYNREINHDKTWNHKSSRLRISNNTLLGHMQSHKKIFLFK